MKLHQLEVFSAVMSTGSLTAAARLVGRSQPAVTRLIQELEASLAFELFDRTGPRLTPTEQGLAFHEEVERSLAGMRSIRERGAEIARQEACRITIAAIPALAAGLLPATLARLDTQDLQRIEIISAPAERVIRLLLERGADLGFASLPLDHRGLDVHWLGEAACVVVMPPDDPLAQQPVVALRDLSGRRVITVANPHRLRQRIDHAMGQASAAPGALLVTNTSFNAMMSARAGLGIALVDPVTAYGIPVAGLTVRPIDATIPFVWGAVTPVTKPPGAIARAIMSAMETEAASLPGFTRHGPEALGTLRDRLALLQPVVTTDQPGR